MISNTISIVGFSAPPLDFQTFLRPCWSEWSTVRECAFLGTGHSFGGGQPAGRNPLLSRSAELLSFVDICSRMLAPYRSLRALS